MIIHQLLIHNFKSYNGVHQLGPFDTHFNCVIGPNGNGKSNIIDAVLFVFGFKSAKLRQDNLTSLIHKSAFARPEQATVTVVFKEGEQITSVSRTIKKSGHTYYKLNDQKINWGELREKLVSKKIDLNKNLFIILQGEVQRLCQLSPEMMVEYLEYVSGSDQLKEPIDLTQRQYIQLSINKEEIRLAQNLKKKVYDNIKEKAQGHATWIFLRMKILLLQHLVIKKILFDNIVIIDNFKRQESEQLAIVTKIESELKLLGAQLKDKRLEFDQISTKAKKIELIIDYIEQKKQKTNLQLKDNQRQINYITKDKEKKEEEKQRYNNEINELKQISEQHADFMKANQQIKQKLSQFKQLGKFKECLQIQEKIQKIQSQQAILAKKAAENQAIILRDRQRLKIVQTQTKRNSELKVKYKNNIKRILEEKGQLNEKLVESDQTISQIERQLKDKPNDKVISNQQKIAHQIRTANKLKIICSDYYLATLREYIIVQAAYRQVFQTIVPQLDFFIVDNVKQATEVLNYLNKKKIGRMTFLIKDLINQSTQQWKAPVSPPNTKLLIDVCKCTTQDAKNVLIWALGSTLVTNKLDTAMKVGYYDEKKYRVITTNGEFIDSSGTMTKLSLKSTQDKEDQQFLVKKLETMKRHKTGIQQRLSLLERSEQQLLQQLALVQTEERSFDGLDQVFVEELEHQLRQDLAKISKNSAETHELSNKLQKKKNDIQATGIKMNNYLEVITLLAAFSKNQEKVKKIESSTNLIETLNEKIRGIQATLATIRTKLQGKVKQKILLESDIMKSEQEVENKKLELTSISYDKMVIEEQIKKIESEMSGMTDQLGNQYNRANGNPKMKEELRKLRNKLKNVEIEQIEMKNKLLESLKEIKEFSTIISKTIFSHYPELIPKINSPQASEQNPINTITGENAQQKPQIKIMNESLLYLGKHQLKFIKLISSKQYQALFISHKVNNNVYDGDLNCIRPSNVESDLVFESIPSKQVKLSHSYEVEKLRLFEKQVNKSEGQFEMDFQIFQQYLQKKKEYELQCDKIKTLDEKLEEIKKQLIEMRNKRMNIFMTHFNEINVQLNIIYTKLTGGRAEINLIDSMNPFEGVQFSVRPVNKSWKRVNLLSGGEKTFTSLALIFACEEIKKFPFYFMDEIDAALDYKNTTLLAHYIKEKKRTQHIVISLRKNMYQECNRVVGIYKVQDQSRTVEINMSELQREQDQFNIQ